MLANRIHLQNATAVTANNGNKAQDISSTTKAKATGNRKWCHGKIGWLPHQWNSMKNSFRWCWFEFCADRFKISVKRRRNEISAGTWILRWKIVQRKKKNKLWLIWCVDFCLRLISNWIYVYCKVICTNSKNNIAYLPWK